MSTDFKYQVFTSPKVAGVTLETVRASLANHFPNHAVTVDEDENNFISTVERLSTSKRTVIAAPPPFLDGEEDKAPKGDAPDAPDEPDEASEPDEAPEDEPKDEEKDEEPKEDKGDGKKKEEPGNDLKKTLNDLKELTKLLPKLQDILEAAGGDLGGSDDSLDIPMGDDATPPPPGAGPHGTPLDEVGPPAGPPVPPGMGGEPPAGLGGPPRKPPVPRGPDARKGPPAGIPGTFARRNKIVYYPTADPETQVEHGLSVIAKVIEENPRYESYNIENIKREGDQYAVHLRLKD